VQTKSVAGTGFEPAADSSEKADHPAESGAESGALGARNGPSDPRLATIIEAWPGLPEPIKEGILAVTQVAGGAA